MPPIYSFATGGGGAQSDLAVLAASMSSGDWSDFTISGLNEDTVYGATTGTAHTILGWVSRGAWDVVHKKMFFVGSSHTGGEYMARAGGVITWDDATNVVTRQDYTWNVTAEGHGYYHLAMDPDTGDLYYRRTYNNDIMRRLYGSSTWTDGNVGSMPMDDADSQVAGGMVWFPELNSNAGGLVFYNWRGFYYSDSTLQTWTFVAAASKPSGDNYHNWIAYANGYVWGGGGVDSQRMWRLSSAGAATQMNDTPLVGSVNLQTGGAGIILAHPNGNDLLQIGNVYSSSTAIYKFTGSSETWGSNIGPHEIGANHYFATTIPDYGVILWLCHTNGEGTDVFAQVYKP